MSNVSYGDPKDFLEAKQTQLGSMVLTHERQFVVPLNQRPWAWKDPKNVQSFLEDFDRILAAFFDPHTTPKWKRGTAARAPHFFGTFVFYKRSDKVYEIFDGQQRLTAMMMLCAVLREIATEVVDIPGAHKQKAQTMHGLLHGWLVIEGGTPRPRLVPNAFFQGLFDALIFDSFDEKARQDALTKLPQAVLDHAIARKLIKSLAHIRNWVAVKLETSTPADKTSFLVAAQDVLSKLFCCIETVIKSEPYSYEVFECLNARGIGLSAADKVKNNLFSVIDKSAHKTISDLWTDIGKNVDNQDIGEFLRRRHIALYGPCKKEDIDLQIKNVEIDKAADAKKLVEEWHEDGARLRAITHGEPHVGTKETRDRLEMIFAVLEAGLASIPLLAASKQLLPAKKDEFAECVVLVEKFIFRALTIEQTKTNDLERKLGDAARLLTSGKSVGEFRKYLRSLSDDTRFESEFLRHAQRRAKVQYYILRELETSLLGSGKGLIPGGHATAKNNIEHVLPKNLCTQEARKHEWGWARASQEKHKALVNRLGNLLILEEEINDDVSNHDFEVKRGGQFKSKSGKTKTLKCYKDSSLPSAKMLCDTTTWPKWTADDIEKRQAEMAKLALKVWRL